MLVSIRIEKSKSISGQLHHDLDKRPIYADEAKSGDNKCWIQPYKNETLVFTFEGINKLINLQKQDILNDHANEIKRKRLLVEERFELQNQVAEKRKIRSWRKDADTHKTMIITFDNEFYLNQKTINREQLDACMLNFVLEFTKKHNCSASYITRHEDETTPHYHVTFTNYNQKTKTTHKFKQLDLSQTQDLAGACFSKMGIHRGIKKAERLDIARAKYPQKEEQTDQEYNYFIKKKANTVNRSVARLKRDLPLEIKELEHKKQEIENERGQQETYLAHQEMALMDIEENCEFLEDKSSRLEGDVADLEAKSSLLESYVAALEDKSSRLEGDVADLEAKSSLLESYVAALEAKSSQLENNVVVLEYRLDKTEAAINKNKRYLKKANMELEGISLIANQKQETSDKLEKRINVYEQRIGSLKVTKIASEIELEIKVENLEQLKEEVLKLTTQKNNIIRATNELQCNLLVTTKKMKRDNQKIEILLKNNSHILFGNKNVNEFLERHILEMAFKDNNFKDRVINHLKEEMKKESPELSVVIDKLKEADLDIDEDSNFTFRM